MTNADEQTVMTENALVVRARALSEQIDKTDRRLKMLYAEREALCRELLAQGMSMNAIGKALGISPAAVGMAVGRYRSRKAQK